MDRIALHCGQQSHDNMLKVSAIYHSTNQTFYNNRNERPKYSNRNINSEYQIEAPSGHSFEKVLFEAVHQINITKV